MAMSTEFDPSREEMHRILRKLGWRRGECWLWRCLLALFLVMSFSAPQQVATVLRVPVNAQLISTPYAAQQLLRRSSGGISAVVFEVAPLSLDASEVERWHAAVSRIARSLPVAVSISGDVDAEVLAVFSAAHQVYGQTLSMVRPGAMPAASARNAEVALLAGYGADDGQAPQGVALAATGGDATRAALLRDWMRGALLSRAGPGSGDALASLGRGRSLRGVEAVEAGLFDGIGFPEDALDWARVQSVGGQKDVTFQTMLFDVGN